MGKLAIRGHITRGKEVIKILEMLGGENLYGNKGNNENFCYYIVFGTNKISYELYVNCKNKSEFYILSLEDFLNKYPYKIGDEVMVVNEHLNANGFIKSLYWYPQENIIRYEVDLSIYTQFCEVNELKPYKEKIVEENLEQIKLTIPNGYEFFRVDDDNKVVLTKKQIQYPKNYEKCCKVLGCKANDFFTNFSYNGCDVEISDYEDKIDDLLQNFRKLRYCRDAYWKIAGEENKGNIDYVICNVGGKIIKTNIPNSAYNHILNFPTEEMRDAFYENFKDLIEQCKELL